MLSKNKELCLFPLVFELFVLLVYRVLEMN